MYNNNQLKLVLKQLLLWREFIQMAIVTYNLADNLEPYIVGEWKIEKKYPSELSTGGNFSVGYEVSNIQTKVKGFLKALDYSDAFNRPDTPDRLNAMTSAYIFERDLLNKCNNKRLRYVIRIIDSGHFELPNEQIPAGVTFCPPVDYIVLEMADCSIRNMIDISQTFDSAWVLRSLHNVAVGIEEMHGFSVAHQDIKPSNILHFEKQNRSKLGDVGRSSSLEMPAKHDEYSYAGDPIYSPFEQLYGEINSVWKVRRYSCDMFMFGNLIWTYFNNMSITIAVLNKLPDSCWPDKWGDSYTDILPQLENAFFECLEEFNHSVESSLRQELINMIQQLCSPDLTKRGDLKNKHLGISQQYSLRRYFTKLDRLAKEYEFKLSKVII